MKRDYNYQAFTPEEKQMMHKFLDLLIEMKQKIKISTDGYCTIIEWLDECEYSNENFVYCNDGEGIYREVHLPDDTYEYVFDFDNRTDEEVINEWLEKNPGWEKNDYGRWINTKDILEI